MLALRSVRLLLRMTGEKVAGLLRFACNDRFEVAGLSYFTRNDRFEVAELLCFARNDGFEVAGLPCFARNDRFEASGLPRFARNDGGRGLVVVSTYLSIHLFFDVLLLEDLLFFYFFVKLS